MVFDTKLKVATLAGLLDVDLTAFELIMFSSVTLLIFLLHITIEHGLLATDKPENYKKRLRKDNWRMTNHGIMCFASFFVLNRQNILNMVFWPENAGTLFFTEQSMPSEVRWLYIFNVANYAQDYMYWVMFTPPPEFVMMNIHHIVTLLLLLSS